MSDYKTRVSEARKIEKSSLRYWNWQRRLAFERVLINKETKLSEIFWDFFLRVELFIRSMVAILLKIIRWRVWSWLRMNASGRPNTCKSRGITEKLAFLVATGARVRNAYGTCPCQGNSPGKLGLMPHSIIEWHYFIIKDLSVQDDHASH